MKPRAIVMLLAATFATAPLLAQAGGCKSSRRDEPLVGPVNLSTPQLELGQRVFMAHCYQCHPGGRAGVGPAINDKPLPRPAIRTQVRAGVGAMPGFDEKKLSDQEVHAVADYVAALHQTGKS